jgi:Ca2+-binding EF-hand superfamily protein
MVAFRDTTEPSPAPLSPARLPSSSSSPTEENEELVRFYFNMFDFDHSGAIGLDELKLVIRCICTDQQSNAVGGSTSSGPAILLGEESGEVEESDVEAMFVAMATKKNQTIDYEEFKSFYHALLVTSSTRSRRPTSTSLSPAK